MPETSTIQVLKAAQLAEKSRNGVLILDTRPAEQFAALHIRRALQISLLGHFAAWSTLLIDPKEELVLVAEDEGGAQEALDRLARVGIHQVIGCSTADEAEWRDLGLDLASITVHRTQSIQEDRERDATLQLIEVQRRPVLVLPLPGESTGIGVSSACSLRPPSTCF